MEKSKNKVGRPKFVLDNKKLFIETLKRVKNKEINNLEAMRICNMRKTLYYRYKKQMEANI